ncbi:hypothetical protein FQZ97_682790 [compost metagenome]
MPGWATQCGSSEGSAASATRPWASSTRTRLALQGRHSAGVVASTCAKRGSRTVKYWAPLSKRPKAVSMLAIRPPGVASRSNTVTRCPACISVRAQATPAMPAPITAKWRAAAGVRWRSAVARALALGMADSFLLTG